VKNVNIKQQFKNIISFFAIVGLLSKTSIVVLPIGKAHAITSLPVVPSSINTTTSLGIAASPFYKSNVVITPHIEHTSIMGVQTWNDTSHFPNYGVGHGVITTADGQDKATWIGYGVGRTNINGIITYLDVMFFNTNSTGKLASLKTLKYYIYLKLTVISEQIIYMSGSNNTILFPI